MPPRLNHAFYDLVIEVAIVRPGPATRIWCIPIAPQTWSRSCRIPEQRSAPVLERTLGIPIFQEQVIELAMVAAGFSAGEVDQLRRAMAAWKKRGGLDIFEQVMTACWPEATIKNLPSESSSRYRVLVYGFESHASFALLVYVSAWLKCHEPAALYCGLLNSLPMGFYSPSQLIQDAQRHAIEVRQIDVSRSDWQHTLKHRRTIATKPALRLAYAWSTVRRSCRTHCRRPGSTYLAAEDLAARASQ